MKKIDYYLWLNSDWAYLGGPRLEDLARRQGAVIDYKPVRLQEVFARTGGIPLRQRAPERQAYRIAELKRWCARLGETVNPTPRYLTPDDKLASCMFIAAKRQGGDLFLLAQSILRAEWVEERDISDRQTLIDIAKACGLDGEALLKAAQAPDIAEALQRYTDEAVAAGVFGSPSYVYRGELFWGQDRLDFLEEAVAAS